MRKTLLFIFLISATSFIAQTFSTGEQTLLTNLKATITIDGTTNITTLTLKGPSNAWFSVGFGGLNMSSGVDVFRTDGTTIIDAISNSRVLPQEDTSQDWSVESNTVSGSVRTIIATRANDTGDANDYVFNPNTNSIPLIYAHGTSTSYGYHGGNRGFTSVAVLSTKQENLLSFSIYPNPSLDVVNVQLSNGTSEAKVKIYDLSGRLMKTKFLKANDTKIDVNNLSSGIYYINVSTDDKIGSQKFIKK
jgi:hypothetical protein